MKYSIKGTPFPVVICDLEQDEKIGEILTTAFRLLQLLNISAKIINLKCWNHKALLFIYQKCHIAYDIIIIDDRDLIIMLFCPSFKIWANILLEQKLKMYRNLKSLLGAM